MMRKSLRTWMMVLTQLANRIPHISAPCLVAKVKTKNLSRKSHQNRFLRSKRRKRSQTVMMKTSKVRNFSRMQEPENKKTNRPKKLARTISISCRPRWTKNRKRSNSCSTRPIYLQSSCPRYHTRCEPMPIRTIAAWSWRPVWFRILFSRTSTSPKRTSPIWSPRPSWHSS